MTMKDSWAIQVVKVVNVAKNKILDLRLTYPSNILALAPSNFDEIN